MFRRRFVFPAAVVVFALVLSAGCGAPTPASSAAPTTPTSSSAPSAPAAAPEKSLYERLGGVDAITAVIDQFMQNVVHDTKINRRFAGANLPHLRQMLIEQVCAATGGPQKYTGGDMKTVHAGMGIKADEFDAIVGDLAAALDHFKVPAREKGELLGALAGFKKDIVATGPTLDDRLDELETRLLHVQMQLDEMNDRLAQLETAGPRATPATGIGTGATPGAETATTAAPPPAPPIHVDIPMGQPIQPRPWTADEKKFFATLVQREETNPTQPTDANDRPNWLGKPLEVTRFISNNGEVLDLKQYRGRKVLLVIMRGIVNNEVCIHCSAQTIALTNAAQQFADRKTAVVIVYPGKPESVPAFLEATEHLDRDFKLPYKIALDVDLAAVRMFDIKGSLAKPTSILIDEQGLVRYVYVGQEPADRPSVKTLLSVIDGLQTPPRADRP
ncbi:MAG: redoxin family protein [Planctomycetota bacterium]